MKQRVLFLCTGNSCRSQMAEGLLRHLASDRFEVFSAGTKPSTVNPDAVKVMAEIGIDISSHRSKSVAEFKGQNFDYAINVCDGGEEGCPFFPWAKQQIHWSFADPAKATGTEEEKIAVFRKVRDEIRAKIIEQFITDNSN